MILIWGQWNPQHRNVNKKQTHSQRHRDTKVPVILAYIMDSTSTILHLARCIRIPTLSGYSLHSHYSHPPSQLSTQPGAHLLLRNSRSRLLGLAESVSSSSIESSLPDRAPFTSLTNSFSLAAAITDTIAEGGGDTVSMNDSKIEKKKEKRKVNHCYEILLANYSLFIYYDHVIGSTHINNEQG